MSDPKAAANTSSWAPLGIKIFRVLWIAQLGSNIGTWMQTVGAQWTLVESAAGATIIALVQTASLTPSLLFSLPAGVVSDSVDRRKLLIGGSAASAVIGAALTAVSAADELTPWALLGFTFLLGTTSALVAPAWQAIQPELVPREQIRAASALGGVTVNGARAIGPALAGVILANWSASVVFAINAFTFVAAAMALATWRRPLQPGLDDREPFGAALRAGVRYITSAHLVRRIFLRSALFALPASALWALLPVTARRLHLNSDGYGLLLGALGVGAVIGVFLLPVVRTRFSDNMTIAVSAVLFASGTVGVAYLPFAAALIVLVVSGLAWIGTLTVLNAALQLTLPQWVRSRGAAAYIFVFLGSQAVGSFGWGAIAEWSGIKVALSVSAAALVVVAASVRLLPLLPGTGTIDRSVDLAWSSPHLVFEPDPTDGPVAVLVTYTVAADDVSNFEDAMRRVGDSRRRTGAYRWQLYRSGESGDQIIEFFLVPSWGEYRRQQTQRLTGRDREILDDARQMSQGEPVEQHFFPAGVSR